MPVDADDLGTQIDAIAADVGLSGAVRVDIGGDVVVERSYGLAHRALGVANTIATQFGAASATKTLTALAVLSLVERGELTLATTARSLLGADLPLIDDRVTVAQLLAHRSGIGDYLTEDDDTDDAGYVLTVPVQELATTEQYLAVLDGHPMRFAPGARFEYCNGGYVVLALLAERAAGVAFHELVDARVCRPAGMVDTTFLRSDELPGRAAIGYLHDHAHAHGLRSNVLHLPVRGNGDGGIYTTAADLHTLWGALFAGQIVAPATVAEMLRPRSDAPDNAARHGLGIWLDDAPGPPTVFTIRGGDAGVGCSSIHSPRQSTGHASGSDGFTCTVLSNQTRGGWPASQRILALLRGTVPRP